MTPLSISATLARVRIRSLAAELAVFGRLVALAARASWNGRGLLDQVELEAEEALRELALERAVVGRARDDAPAGVVAVVLGEPAPAQRRPYRALDREERLELVYGDRIRLDADDFLERADLVDDVLGDLARLPEHRRP